MYEEITKKIRITVNPEFLEEHSDPDEKRFIWAYHVKIENQGIDTVQLLSRSWKITDALGRVQEVRGSGVVGEQPILKPNDFYKYTSFCPLKTEFGSMSGFYIFAKKNGDRFKSEIPEFGLITPHNIN